MKVVATEANIPFFSVSSVDIIGKYSEESEKLIKNLFAIAREKKPSIIFFEQIDSILSTKLLMNEFMKQMKEINNNDKNILFLATTNVPWDLDSLALNLFQKKIYIGLPEFEERKLLFKINLSDIKNDINDEQFNNLSKLTEGYTGSDIYNLTQDALHQTLRKKPNFPYDKKEEDIKEKTLNQNDKNEIEETSIITMEDFVQSLEEIKRTVTKNDLKRYNDFTEEFGIKG